MRKKEREGDSSGTLHTSFYCALLHSSDIVSCLYFILFYKLKASGNPTSNKSIGTIFPAAFSHFISLCYILFIITEF